MLATSVVIGGETNAESEFVIVSGAGKDFFAAGGASVPNELRPLLIVSTKASKLKASEHRAVVSKVWKTMAEILRANFVPSGEFIAKNIMLYPADELHPADMAVLRYMKGSNEYMVVVSGQDVHGLYLFIRGNNVSIPESAYGETNAIFKLVETYFKLTSLESSLPPEIIVEKRGSVGVLNVKRRGEWNSNILNGLTGACYGNEVALALSFDYRCGMANRAPPRKWFDTINKLVKDNEEIDKKLEEMMSPESIERERRRRAIELDERSAGCGGAL